MSPLVFLFRYFVRTAVLGGTLGIVVLLILGYARDAVRLFNMRQIPIAISLSHDRAGGPGYPARLEDIVGPKKVLTEYPKDPITAMDWESVNTILQSLGVPESIIDTHVTEENGYRYVYEASWDRREYELSTKLESVFMARRMQEDGGNDDARYEVGSDLTIDTTLAGTSTDPQGTQAQRAGYTKLQKVMEQVRKKQLGNDK